jgi:dienelactone hydrolase
MRAVLALTLTLVLTLPGLAAVQTKDMTYEFDGVKFNGQLVWDDAVQGKRPGVLVVHEWWGLDDYAKGRAKQLAGMGYVAFACDMYGNGKHVDHPMDAQGLATSVRKNVDVWRGRALAALKVLAENEHVDSSKLAAIGYCFGGSTCLQLAYSGADLKAIATFHAALPTPKPEEAKAVKPKVLVCHGADDEFIPPDAIDKFKAALKDAGKDLRFESYPGAVHSFTVPGADKHMIKGMAYNADADKKSWAAMTALFEETLKK